MSSKKGYNDLKTHHLIELREPPASVIALRHELYKPVHLDIYNAAFDQPNFETALATIATKLNVIVDGTYDVWRICEMLAEKLRKREKEILKTAQLGAIIWKGEQTNE